MIKKLNNNNVWEGELPCAIDLDSHEPDSDSAATPNRLDFCRQFENKLDSRDIILPKIVSLTGAKTQDRHSALCVKLRGFNKESVQFAKVIRQHGMARGYFLKFIKHIIRLDFSFIYNKSYRQGPRKDGFGVDFPEFKQMWLNFQEWEKSSILEMFSVYCRLTQPVLAFYLFRKRSFKKKRKVFLNRFFLKMAKPGNSFGKLAHQIHAIYFRKKNRKKLGDSDYSTRKFLEMEVFNPGSSELFNKKQFIFKKRGHEAMNILLLQTRYE